MLFFLDCASVMVYGIQCLLVSIFAISLSFLGSGLLRSLGYFFLIGSLVFLLLSFSGSFYILDSGSLPGVSLANVCFQPVLCLFMHLAVYFTEQEFRFQLQHQILSS